MCRRIALLGFVAAIAPAIVQGGAGMQCSAQDTPIAIRAGGLEELLPDIVVSCTSGTPTPEGQPVSAGTFIVTLNAPVASRVLFAAPEFYWSEALVLVDDPAPANQLPCTAVGGVCSITGTGSGNGTYNGSLGRPNVFQGDGQSDIPNRLTFTLPVDPPNASGSRKFRFTNLRTNTSGLPIGFQILASVSVTFSASLTGSPLTVATVQTGLTADAREPSSVGSRLSTFKVHMTENSVNVFKLRTSIGPFPTNQNVPGSPANFETGFRNSAFPNTAQGNLGLAGLADTGTRVLVQLDAVPFGVTVTVPTSVSFGLFAQGVAQLVTTDLRGAGPYAPASNGVIAPDGEQRITAVYEFTQSVPASVETLEILFTLNYGAGAPASLQQMTGSVGLAPLVDADSNTIPSFIPNQFIAFQVTAPPPANPLSITTGSPLPPGTVGNPYSTAIVATGGTPGYRFFFVGNPPPGVSLSQSGTLSGTPPTAGTFNFAIQVVDSVNTSVVAGFSITIVSQSFIFQLSTGQIVFNAPQGGAAPPIQSLTIQSVVQQAVNFTISTDGGSAGIPAPKWLAVVVSSTAAPYRITVAANQGDMPEGVYNARILVGEAGNTGQPVLIVTVTLNVLSFPPKLSVFPDVLKFARQINKPGTQSRNVQLFNSGGGGPIPFTASVVKHSPWVKAITPSQGVAGTNNPATVRVDVDTTGVPLGFQRDVIRFTWAGGQTDLPVVLFVAPSGSWMQLSRTGVYFRSIEGAVNLQTRQVRVLNLDPFSAMSWKATVLRGEEWLDLNPSTGVSTFSDPGWVTLSVKASAAGLPAGPRYALVRIDALNTANAPQYLVAVLDIQTAAGVSALDYDDAGAVLIGSAGSTQNVSHTFNITTGSNKVVPFSASISSATGAGIFSIAPAGGNVVSSAATRLTVSANLTGVGAGIYTAEIAVATAARVETLAVTLIVVGSAGGQSLPAGARAADCVRASLAATQIGLTNSFSVPAGWPTALVVDLRDNCGSQVLDGSIVASFSNGDPPLNLTGDNTSSLYSATWQPVAQVNPMTITIHAETPDLPDVTVPLTGGVVANPVPTLFQNGTVHNLDPKLGGPLSPGLVAAAYGTNLATVVESTPPGPLPTTYKGTQMLIGPYEAPIYFVSPGQINVQVPSELTANLPYSVVVSVNGALTLPDTVAMVPAVPGIAVYGDGKVIAQHNDFAAHPPYPFVVTDADPATRGEYLIVYLVGLGLTDPFVPSGAQSPAAEPLGRPLLPVTMTLGGQVINPPFIGLTPFAIGLYQISFQVPLDAPLNTPLDLVITQDGLTANATTLTIAP